MRVLSRRSRCRFNKLRSAARSPRAASPTNRSVSPGPVGVVEAIGELANEYSAGGRVIVIEILAQPDAKGQPSNASLRDNVERPLRKDVTVFVTISFGAQYPLQNLGPTVGASQVWPQNQENPTDWTPASQRIRISHSRDLV